MVCKNIILFVALILPFCAFSEIRTPNELRANWRVKMSGDVAGGEVRVRAFNTLYQLVSKKTSGSVIKKEMERFCGYGFDYFNRGKGAQGYDYLLMTVLLENFFENGKAVEAFKIIKNCCPLYVGSQDLGAFLARKSFDHFEKLFNIYSKTKNQQLRSALVHVFEKSAPFQRGGLKEQLIRIEKDLEPSDKFVSRFQKWFLKNKVRIELNTNYIDGVPLWIPLFKLK
jgi:hypothetical protein